MAMTNPLLSNDHSRARWYCLAKLSNHRSKALRRGPKVFANTPPMAPPDF